MDKPEGYQTVSSRSLWHFHARRKSHTQIGAEASGDDIGHDTEHDADKLVLVGTDLADDQSVAGVDAGTQPEEDLETTCQSLTHSDITWCRALHSLRSGYSWFWQYKQPPLTAVISAFSPSQQHTGRHTPPRKPRQLAPMTNQRRPNLSEILPNRMIETPTHRDQMMLKRLALSLGPGRFSQLVIQQEEESQGFSPMSALMTVKMAAAGANAQYEASAARLIEAMLPTIWACQK